MRIDRQVEAGGEGAVLICFLEQEKIEAVSKDRILTLLTQKYCVLTRS